MNISLNAIGKANNDINGRMDANWGEVVSKIQLDIEYFGALKGLEEFTHVIILTYLHEANYSKEKHLQRRPRNLTDMPLVGILSQRAKNRPNPIGVTSVKIVNVTNEYLEVIGLDAINGTPVLDIKPYYPHYDKVNDAEVPKWVESLMKGYF